MLSCRLHFHSLIIIIIDIINNHNYNIFISLRYFQTGKKDSVKGLGL